MSVLAFLPPRLLRHLQFVLGRERPVVTAKSWKHMIDLLEKHPVSVAIIDPSSAGANTGDLERLLNEYPSLPIMAYVPLTPAAFRAVAELSKVGLDHAILYSHDDSAERLIATLDRLHATPLTDRMLDALRPSLSRLPMALAKTIEEMFEEPHRFANARDIAVGANIALVRLYRALHSVDLASPKKLLIAAKLLRAYSFLADPGHSVRSVSKKLGYRQPRILGDHTFEVFGLSPSRFRARVREDELILRLREWVSGVTEDRGKIPA